MIFVIIILTKNMNVMFFSEMKKKLFKKYQIIGKNLFSINEVFFLIFVAKIVCMKEKKWKLFILTKSFF